MNDHAPRIRAQQQAEHENAVIADLEQHSAPLLWAVYLVVLTTALSLAVDGVAGHLARVADLAADQEALVQCINGRAIGLTLSPPLSRDAGEGANENGNLESSDAVLRCEVRNYKLVGGDHV